MELHVISERMPIADNISELVPGLWTWSAYGPEVKVDLSSCAIRSDEGLIIVDPIDLDEKGMSALWNAGRWHSVVLTNANHARQSEIFRKRCPVPILAHPDAAMELEIRVDGVVRAGELVGGNIQVLDVSGGGVGEIALYHPAGRIHFGDAVVNLESTGLSLLPEKYCSDLERLKKAIRGLKGFRAEIMTFAHGAPVVESVDVGFEFVLSLAR